MNTLQIRGILEPPNLSPHSIELRQRVEQLEHLRQSACRHRDRAMVDTIDAQIKYAVCQWIDSIIEGLEAELPARSVETKAA